jgi:adenosine kinase
LNNQEKSLNYKSAFLGAIGEDRYGNKLYESLLNAQVHPVIEKHETSQTSRCAVGVHLKERCLLTHIVPATVLTETFVKNNLDKILSFDFLVIEGYYILAQNSMTIINMLVKEFKSRGKKVVVSYSSTFVAEKFSDVLRDLSNKSDLIFCNMEEAVKFTNLPSSADIEDIAIEIHKKLDPHTEGRLLAITNGKNPVCISSYDYEANSIDYILKSSPEFVHNDEIVDTNGCGDAFLGGFLAYYAAGKSLEKCAKAVK